MHMYREGRNLSHPASTFPAKIKQRELAFLFHSSHTINKFTFCGLFNAIFCTFLCFLLVLSMFKMAPKQSAEVLSTVPNYKRLWCVLLRKYSVRVSFVLAWVIVLLTVSSMLTNHQYVLNKVSLNEIHIKQIYSCKNIVVRLVEF